MNEDHALVLIVILLVLSAFIVSIKGGIRTGMASNKNLPGSYTDLRG